MIKAVRKGGALLKDVSKASGQIDQFHIWWLGQSGYLIKWNDKYLLLDPYLSDSLTDKYAQTDKPHVRMSELIIDPIRLDFVDIVTSSHNHTDHLDGETLIPLISVNPGIKMIIPEANRDFVIDRIKCAKNFPIGLNDGDMVEIEGIAFHGIVAAHNDVKRDPGGKSHFLGYLIELGPFSIYHSGDTIWHDTIIEQLKPFKIDLALLPINGNKPERRVAGNLNAWEAVRLAKLVGIKHVIPCHYDMFTFNTADPLEFKSMAKKEGQAVTLLGVGEKWSLVK